MNLIKLFASGAILCSVVSLVPVMADETAKNVDVKHHSGKWGEHERFGGRDFNRLGEALALTDTQKETLKSQREADKTARTVLHDRLKAAHEALVTAASAGANDAELAALADILGKLHAEQALAGAKKQQAFLAVLTVEQKQKLNDFKAKRMERMEHRTAKSS
jgi:periplasmic protein CpxP/Spy